MTLQTRQHVITIHMFYNISRSKENGTMKFGQLIENIMRNTFLEISYKKFGVEDSPRPYYKKSKLSTSLDQYSEMLWSLFLLHAQVKSTKSTQVYQNILKRRCWPLLTTLYKAFLRNKKSSRTTLLVSFSAWFLEKMFFNYIL